MKMYMFEGTPEEISHVVKTMQPMTAVLVKPEDVPNRITPIATSRSAEDADKFVTVEFARKVLSRREMSEPLKILFRTLYAAGADFVSSAELYERTGYGVAQFSGLMGAFGRRMANTNGFDQAAHFFDFRRINGENAWEYRLPDTVREALELEGLA